MLIICIVYNNASMSLFFQGADEMSPLLIGLIALKKRLESIFVCCSRVMNLLSDSAPSARYTNIRLQYRLCKMIEYVRCLEGRVLDWASVQKKILNFHGFLSICEYLLSSDDTVAALPASRVGSRDWSIAMSEARPHFSSSESSCALVT